MLHFSKSKGQCAIIDLYPSLFAFFFSFMIFFSLLFTLEYLFQPILSFSFFFLFFFLFCYYLLSFCFQTLYPLFFFLIYFSLCVFVQFYLNPKLMNRFWQIYDFSNFQTSFIPREVKVRTQLMISRQNSTSFISYENVESSQN